jgi:hypothetical protein
MKLYHPHDLSYTLAAESQTSMDAWISLLRGGINKAKDLNTFLREKQKLQAQFSALKDIQPEGFVNL